MSETPLIGPAGVMALQAAERAARDLRTVSLGAGPTYALAVLWAGYLAQHRARVALRSKAHGRRWSETTLTRLENEALVFQPDVMVLHMSVAERLREDFAQLERLAGYLAAPGEPEMWCAGVRVGEHEQPAAEGEMASQRWATIVLIPVCASCRVGDHEGCRARRSPVWCGCGC